MLKYFLILIVPLLIFAGCKKDETDSNNQEAMMKAEKEFNSFADTLVSKIRNLDTSYQLTYFEASIASNDDNWKKVTDLEVKLNKVLSDTTDFNRLKEFQESGLIKDDLAKRNLEVLFFMYLSKQVDEGLLTKMAELGTKIENKYSNYRAVVDGKEYTDNDVEDVLKTSTNSEELKKVWMAHKDIGPVVEDDIKKLVNLRNQAAKQIGFDNYHQMSLKLSEQDPEYIEKLFDELDSLTRDSFIEVKSEIDDYLSKRYGISKDELMPWHYQNRYFQEAPKIYSIDLDNYYKNIDFVKTTIDYYKGLGLEIEDIVAKSDLYEKPNKNQHAYCIDIDRVKMDIRVLCNIKPNYNWMNTSLHEFGHSIYEKYLDDDLPWALKQPAHIFTTEAIAMMFGRMASNPEWLHDVIGISSEEKGKISKTAFNILRMEQLVFSRWAQVMYRFEKSMYENPDQDLNALWWNLVEKYQMIKKPKGRNMPDWATKIHIATSPCYYHNYLLGELFASQLYNTLNTKVLKNKPGTMSSFAGSKLVGKYLIENVFNPGARYYWDDMIEKATGEKLSPKYYADQFVKK